MYRGELSLNSLHSLLIYIFEFASQQRERNEHSDKSDPFRRGIGSRWETRCT